ncbi:MAG: AtpZ/AtpI family protein [Candidatus Obscuribacterales bacterium]|nr:AtpZ/AtpI family protein [Candidatus Obscuribacterales bacterium]
MNRTQPNSNSNPDTTFVDKIAKESKRKLFAQNRSTPIVWSGFGMMGLIGWSIVVPTLLGVALGNWIDSNYVGTHSWTLMLMVAGLSIGCFNAIQFVARESASIEDEQKQQQEPIQRRDEQESSGVIKK